MRFQDANIMLAELIENEKPNFKILNQERYRNLKQTGNPDFDFLRMARFVTYCYNPTIAVKFLSSFDNLNELSPDPELSSFYRGLLNNISWMGRLNSNFEIECNGNYLRNLEILISKYFSVNKDDAESFVTHLAVSSSYLCKEVFEWVLENSYKFLVDRESIVSELGELNYLRDLILGENIYSEMKKDISNNHRCFVTAFLSGDYDYLNNLASLPLDVKSALFVELKLSLYPEESWVVEAYLSITNLCDELWKKEGKEAALAIITDEFLNDSAQLNFLSDMENIEKSEEFSDFLYKKIECFDVTSADDSELDYFHSLFAPKTFITEKIKMVINDYLNSDNKKDFYLPPKQLSKLIKVYMILQILNRSYGSVKISDLEINVSKNIDLVTVLAKEQDIESRIVGEKEREEIASTLKEAFEREFQESYLKRNDSAHIKKLFSMLDPLSDTADPLLTIRVKSSMNEAVMTSLKKHLKIGDDFLQEAFVSLLTQKLSKNVEVNEF